MLKTMGKLKGFYSPLLDSTGVVNHLFGSRLSSIGINPVSPFYQSDIKATDREGKVLPGASGFYPGHLFILKQVHGNNVHVVDDPETSYDLEGDGIITHRSRVAIGVLTADCLPILILEPGKRIIAAIHAGWRGMVKGVILEGVKRMKEYYDASSEEMIVAIGPHIKECCYVVGRDVAEVIRDRYPDGEYRYDSRGKASINLATCAMEDLRESGVKMENTDIVGPCTSCDEKHLYSYRRDGKTGRQLSFIELR